ncbi:MAG: hypothetical protein GQ582_07055, partial [Methyloprofundus sp.]|nr:hypothetical protein [Methyloprofundus sp.]
GATGAGWEENVAHAVRIVRGITQEGRDTHTRKEEKLLRKMGVGVETVPGRFFGTNEVKIPLHPRISPQELQQKKVEVLTQNKPLTTINAIGWSRGGVSCIMFANALHDIGINVPVNIFACDPVPGAGNFDKHRVRLHSNVQNYVGIYAADERSRGFTPVLPSTPTSTRTFIMSIPGKHATLVGNASDNGGSGAASLYGPGKITRDLAEKYLTQWGTPLRNKLNLSDVDILQLYDGMISRNDKYQAMHNKAYILGFTQNERSVGLGDGSSSTFNARSNLSLGADAFFVNSHHRGLFANRYAALYHHIFDGRPMSKERLELEMFNLKMMYPSLYAALAT